MNRTNHFLSTSRTALILLLATLHPLWTLKGETCEIYDGWAIYLMIYPFIVMFAAAGYEGILRKIDDKYTNFVIVSLVLLLCLMPLRHIFFHYRTLEVYFNELSGGIANAYGKYAIDEGENANKAVCRWLIENATIHHDTARIKVFTDGNAGCDYYFRQYNDIFSLTHTSLQKSDTAQWDYFISFANAVPAQQLLNKRWENRRAIKKIYVENKPIAIILHKSHLRHIPDTTSTPEMPELIHGTPIPTNAITPQTSPLPDAREIREPQEIIEPEEISTDSI